VLPSAITGTRPGSQSAAGSGCCAGERRAGWQGTGGGQGRWCALDGPAGAVPAQDQEVAAGGKADRNAVRLDGAVTENREAPADRGLGTCFQAAPFQCRISSPASAVVPTAQASRADRAATAFRTSPARPEHPPASGTGTTGVPSLCQAPDSETTSADGKRALRPRAHLTGCQAAIHLATPSRSTVPKRQVRAADPSGTLPRECARTQQGRIHRPSTATLRDCRQFPRPRTSGSFWRDGLCD
jgi:hypothetical protein